MTQGEITSWLFSLFLCCHLGSCYFGGFGLDSSRVNVRFCWNFINTTHKCSRCYDFTLKSVINSKITSKLFCEICNYATNQKRSHSSHQKWMAELHRLCTKYILVSLLSAFEAQGLWRKVYLFSSGKIQLGGTEINLPWFFCCFVSLYILTTLPSSPFTLTLCSMSRRLLCIQDLCFHSVDFLDSISESLSSTRNLKIAKTSVYIRFISVT